MWDTLQRLKGEMNCDGVINEGDDAAFQLALTATPPDYPEYYAQYPNCNHLNGDINGDGVLNAMDIDLFTEYLAGHGGATGVRAAYVWDAENRLVAVIPTAPVAGRDQKVECGYDHVGRRVEKRVYNWTGSAWQEAPALRRRFVWSGWLVLMELDGENNPVRKYTWGLDLSGVASGLRTGRLGDAGQSGDRDPSRDRARHPAAPLVRGRKRSMGIRCWRRPEPGVAQAGPGRYSPL